MDVCRPGQFSYKNSVTLHLLSPSQTEPVRNGLFYGEASHTFILSMFYMETHRYTFLFPDIYKYGEPAVYIGLEYEWEIEIYSRNGK